MFNLIAILLGVAAIVVYVKAVRYDKEWGTPVMTLLVLGAVVAVILPMTGMERRMQQRRWERLRFESERLLGEALAPHLSEGSNILLVLSPDAIYEIQETLRYREEMEHMDEPPPEMEDMPTVEEYLAGKSREFQEAFEEGSRFSVNIVASVVPGLDPEDPYTEAPDMYMENLDYESFNEILEPYENQNIEAIVSMAGLPRYHDRDTGEEVFELEFLDCFEEWADTPLFAAANLGLRYDPDILREYIQDGILTAAVVFLEAGGDRKIITTENIEELPDSPPRER